MADTILFSQTAGVARLVFNNVERHNALGKQELAGIEQALQSLEPETRVLLIHAQGDRTFCAGADLAQISSGELSGDRFQAVTNQIAGLTIPSIAFINGNVFGGGVELALSCDLRIGVTDSVMRVPAAALGLCYPPDGIRRFVDRLGITVAKRILLAAEEFSAEDMLRVGVIDQLESRVAGLEVAEALAARIARHAPMAVSGMLSIVDQIERKAFDAGQAKAISDQCALSADFQEGLAARRERRLPVFTGR